WEIQPQLSDGTLVTVLDDFAVPGYPIQAVYPQQRYLPAKIRCFVEYLREVYQRPGYWETGGA
ncbi:MAG TPA: LysR substrate-binding domain-containing protein, partial [Nitrospira sp.]|nr:LysR substrate-binding domain-containing protein [Nitrospira sp.]